MVSPDPAGSFGLSEIDPALSTTDAAFAYARQGLKTIFVHAPVFADTEVACTCRKEACRSQGKHPVAKAWQKIATCDPDALRDQLSSIRFSDPNVGIVLGEQAGGQYLIAIDVDSEERFGELSAELGPLPETVQSVSGSGRGYHLLFEAPVEVAPGNMHNGPIGDKPGVDAKVHNGQIVVAPSVHKAGKRYEWKQFGSFARLPVPWALALVKREPPKWIHEYTPQTIRDNNKIKKRAEAYLQKAVMEDCSALASCGEGLRNNHLYERSIRLFYLCSQLLIGARWSYVHDQLFQAATACGLDKREIHKTLSSAETTIRAKSSIRMPVALADPPSGIHSAAPPAPPQDKRPRIRITTETHQAVDEAALAILADTNLFQRDGKLVHVTRVTAQEPEKCLVEGSPQIREVSTATLFLRLTKFAVFEKYDGRTSDYRLCEPTDHIVSGLHDMGEWPRMRSIVGIIETPTIRPDGIVIQDTGYDSSTGYLYMPSANFPRVPERPTQGEACDAMRSLQSIFCDFPYANDAHQAVPIAAILTLVARPAIRGATPAFLFDASTRGSGKTLQTDAIAMVLTGRCMPRMNYPFDEDELEKVLGSYALRGTPFFSLDNVARAFGGGALDRVITARDTVDLRILGRSEVPTVCWRAVVLATGNNMTLCADTARRVLKSRLEPQEEHPERRTEFVHEDLLAWVLEYRPALVTAALTILRAYFVAGRPDKGCARWGSFEEWSRLIPHAMRFAGSSDPMLARPSSDGEVDSESNAFGIILNELHRLRMKEFKANGLIERLFRAQRERGPDGTLIADGYDDLRQAVLEICPTKPGQYPDPKTLGKRLGRFRGRIMDGLKLDSDTGRGGIARWEVIQVDVPTKNPSLS